MLSIGITGGIGSGKSTVCRILEHLGYPVFYADQAGRSISDNDPAVRALITALLGDQAYFRDALNRAWVAERIFSDEALKDALNAIIHPAVFKAFDSWKAEVDAPLVFNESALLIETGSYLRFDCLVAVLADETTRIKRVQERDALQADQIRSRMLHQVSDDHRLAVADFVIYNNDGVLLTPQVVELVNKLLVR